MAGGQGRTVEAVGNVAQVAGLQNRIRKIVEAGIAQLAGLIGQQYVVGSMVTGQTDSRRGTISAASNSTMVTLASGRIKKITISLVTEGTNSEI